MTKQILFLLFIFSISSNAIKIESFDELQQLLESNPNLNENPEYLGSIQEQVQELLRKKLENFDPLVLPFVPTINYKSDPKLDIDVALTLTDITIKGLSKNLNVTDIKVPVPFVSPHVMLEVTFSKLSAEVKHYSSGGHLKNIPFSGRSKAEFSLEGLKIKFKADTERVFIYCVKLNSTRYDLQVKKPFIKFYDLNPGTDIGELINTVLTGLAPDALKLSSKNLNGKWHSVVDPLVVKLVNSVKCNTDNSTLLKSDWESYANNLKNVEIS